MNLHPFTTSLLKPTGTHLPLPQNHSPTPLKPQPRIHPRRMLRRSLQPNRHALPPSPSPATAVSTRNSDLSPSHPPSSPRRTSNKIVGWSRGRSDARVLSRVRIREASANSLRSLVATALGKSQLGPACGGCRLFCLEGWLWRPKRRTLLRRKWHR